MILPGITVHIPFLYICTLTPGKNLGDIINNGRKARLGGAKL